MRVNFQVIETEFEPTDDGKCTLAERGMVATQSPQATDAGVRILHNGGNAVDAAIAAALTLGVTESQASGIGGQTMMLINLDGKVIAVDGSSRAPSLAHVSAIYKEDMSLGYRATTVPSTPATLWYVQNRYGKIKWEQVMEPAIQYAEDGYPISVLQNRLQARELENFKKVPSKSGATFFLDQDLPYAPETIFKQPELAAMLRRIAEKGVEEFYRGTIAKQIDADMRENGGILRYDDLALIPWPIERKPLRRKFRGLSIFTMPPPGSGRSLLFALLMLNPIPQRTEYKKPNLEHLMLIHVLRKTLLERSDRPFDPNFFPQGGEEKTMLSARYARKRIRSIMKEVDRSVLSSIATDDELSGETTHLSVMDENGMAVSLTQSIERVYGSKAAAADLGFLYNNYLFDFDYKVPQHPFYLRPNAVPWATVAPSLVFRGNDIWMAVGSPGSERIISTLAQFFTHITDESMSIAEAMKAPRLHCSLGGRVSLEADRFDPSLLDLLREKGFRIDAREPYAFYLGCIQAVLKRQTGEGFQGIADVRRDGAAKGL